MCPSDKRGCPSCRSASATMHRHRVSTQPRPIAAGQEDLCGKIQLPRTGHSGVPRHFWVERLLCGTLRSFKMLASGNTTQECWFSGVISLDPAGRKGKRPIVSAILGSHRDHTRAVVRNRSKSDRPASNKFFGDGIGGVWCSCLYPMINRGLVVVGGAANAARIDEDASIAKPYYRWKVCVPAEDQTCLNPRRLLLDLIDSR